MSDKYPSLSAYNYCAWNPVMLVDPDGRELDVADNEASKNDLLSIVSAENRNRVKMEGGKVSVNTSGLSKKELKKDKGLSLINNMVKSEKRHLFESTEVSILQNEDGNAIGLYNNALSAGIVNASNGGKDSKGSHEHRPPQGYDGYVTISSSGSYTSREGGNVRKSVIFHELMENFFRTDQGLDYHQNGLTGAHAMARKVEGLHFGNRNPGSAAFQPFSANKAKMSMMHFIILERTKL